jgi:hypothetical protein
MNIGKPTTEHPILIPEEPVLPQTEPAPDPIPAEPSPEAVPA